MNRYGRHTGLFARLERTASDICSCRSLEEVVDTSLGHHSRALQVFFPAYLVLDPVSVCHSRIL